MLLINSPCIRQAVLSKPCGVAFGSVILGVQSGGGLGRE